jgi:hypothetical protein
MVGWNHGQLRTWHGTTSEILQPRCRASPFSGPPAVVSGTSIAIGTRLAQTLSDVAETS